MTYTLAILLTIHGYYHFQVEEGWAGIIDFHCATHHTQEVDLMNLC